MAFLLGFVYFLAGPELVNTFLNKTSPGRLIKNKAQIGCQSNQNPLFTNDITDLDTIELITPPGSIVDSEAGKLFKSHAFLVSKNKSPIYAPIDSKLTSGSFYIEEGIVQYLLFFEASCEVYYKFDHVQEPVDKVKTLFTGEATNDSRTSRFQNGIEFKAGELIGYTQGTLRAKTWDFGVYNNQKTNIYQGLDGISLSDMDYEAVCPFDYFAPHKTLSYKTLFGNVRPEEPTPKLICN